MSFTNLDAEAYETFYEKKQHWKVPLKIPKGIKNKFLNHYRHSTMLQPLFPQLTLGLTM